MAQQRRRVVKRTARSGSRFQKILYSFKPANLKAYWFSKQGARMALKVVGVGFLVVFLMFLYVAKDLPNPNKVRQIAGGQNTKYYDRTGQTLLWEDHGDQNRTVIDFNQMPASLKQATIAIEDKNFYNEGAFSFVGYIRAAVFDVLHRGAFQGGSTITQQYVKNALLSNDQTFTRKFKELILSIEISSYYKKDDVLKLYLNQIPYGSQAYGVEAACKTYFPKDNLNNSCAPNLTLPESALLAAMANAPSFYSPYGTHQTELKDRQHLVLDRMVAQGYITNQQAGEAKKVDILGPGELSQTQNLYANITAPQFDLYAKDVLAGEYGTSTVESGGLKVITTLDVTKQKQAEDAIAVNLASIQRSGGSNAALVSADPKTGQIFAMVGSTSFSNSPFNVALAKRQPGSSFKPYVYATAWGKSYNYGPGSTLYDVTTDFGNFKPKNYDGSTHGVQAMRTALDNSYNIPAVKTLYLVGVKNAIDTARSMGITTLDNPPNGGYGLSLVLGSGEVELNQMTNAYESFANGGLHYAPTPILKVYDSTGKLLQDNTKPSSKQVLDPQVAYLMNNVLSDNNARAAAFGVNNPLTVSGHTVAAKTGTTTDYHDAWTMGYSPDLVTGVWVGNNDNKVMNSEAVDIAAPVWHTFMTNALRGQPNTQFNKPNGIQTVTLDADTGRLPTPATKHTRTDVFASWYKPPTATSTQSAKIDKVSGKLATDCTPPLAVDTVYSGAIHAEIPATDPAYGRWEPPVAALAANLGFAGGGSLPTETDNVHSCSDTKPSISVTANGSGPVDITTNATAGTFPLDKIEIKFDDQIISTESPVDQNPYSFTYTPTTTGQHTITATVTDKGLYQTQSNSITVTITNTGTAASFVGIAPADGSHQSGPTLAFSWTVVPSATQYQLFLTRNGAPYVPANPAVSTGTSAFVPIVGSGTYTWHVDAYSGSTKLATTPIYSFTE